MFPSTLWGAVLWLVSTDAYRRYEEVRRHRAACEKRGGS
jgi:hypothetical protein